MTLCMFRTVFPSVIRSSSNRHLSNRYCCLLAESDGTQRSTVTTGAHAWRRFVWRHITLFPWELDWKTVSYGAHNILIIKPNICTNFSNLFFGWNSTYFGHFLCPKHVQFYYKNKFEKLVHLIGFIIRIYHEAWSPEGQMLVISTKKIKLCQTTEKNDSDRNIITKHVSVFEQNNSLRFLFVWAVAQSPRKSWTLLSLTITPPSSFEMSGYYQPLNKAAPRPWRTETSTTPRRKPNNSPVTSCLSLSVLYCVWKL